MVNKDFRKEDFWAKETKEESKTPGKSMEGSVKPGKQVAPASMKTREEKGQGKIPEQLKAKDDISQREGEKQKESTKKKTGKVKHDKRTEKLRGSQDDVQEEN
ncbi:hypothetical protein MRX96_020679 [Rhipicephalus microplus]